MNVEKRERIYALITTAIVALLLILLFLVVRVGSGRSALAAASIPETGTDEELFIDPELDLEEIHEGENIESPGAPQEESQTDVSPADAFKGEPDPAPVEQPMRIEPGTNPKAAPPVPKPVTQTKPSPVKATEPTIDDRERQRATSSVSNAFSGKNGSATGSSTGRGASTGKGSGLSVQGNLSGRKFLGCDKFTPVLERKTVVKVAVVVNAAGKVTKATAQTAVESSLRRQCERAALSARWTESPGAADQRGTLTFTITPK